MTWEGAGGFIQAVGVPFAGMCMLGYLLMFVLKRINGKLDRVAERVSEAIEANTIALEKVEHSINNFINYQVIVRRERQRRE